MSQQKYLCIFLKRSGKGEYVLGLIVVFSVSSQEKVSGFQLVLQVGGHGKNKSFQVKKRWSSKTA